MLSNFAHHFIVIFLFLFQDSSQSWQLWRISNGKGRPEALSLVISTRRLRRMKACRKWADTPTILIKKWTNQMLIQQRPSWSKPSEVPGMKFRCDRVIIYICLCMYIYIVLYIYIKILVAPRKSSYQSLDGSRHFASKTFGCSEIHALRKCSNVHTTMESAVIMKS